RRALRRSLEALAASRGSRPARGLLRRAARRGAPHEHGDLAAGLEVARLLGDALAPREDGERLVAPTRLEQRAAEGPVRGGVVGPQAHRLAQRGSRLLGAAEREQRLPEAEPGRLVVALALEDLAHALGALLEGVHLDRALEDVDDAVAAEAHLLVGAQRGAVGG